MNIDEGKFTVARFSDFGGRTNPGRVWSPAFIFLKQAIDRDAPPQETADALRNWLAAYRRTTPGEIDGLIKKGPGDALSNIVKLIGANYDEERLPATALASIRKAIAHIAGNYISSKRGELDKERQALDQLDLDFRECVDQIVNFLLEAERRSCGMCEREFGVHDPDASHGNCKRHTIDSYKDIIKHNANNKDRIEPLIKKIMAMPDENFPPDLAMPQNEQLRNSLMRKDYASHDRQVKDFMNQTLRARGEQPA